MHSQHLEFVRGHRSSALWDIGDTPPVPRAGSFEVYSGIIYSYICGGVMCQYHSIISIALNLNNDWNHVSAAYKCARIALIFVCKLFSANKNVRYRLSPLISEELAQSFNERKVSS